jgi:rod shape determining protein RodA
MFGKNYVPKNPERIAQLEKEMATGKKKDYGYNVKQSKIAIGSGGLLGKGFLQGVTTQGDFVPEQHTDFIFTALAESFGFWGSALLLGLYFLLLYRIISLAERQRSTFSRVYAYSVAAILFFHVFINICMTIGLMPVIGITLPLLSYGGSSLITFTVLIFIMLRLDADRQMVLR